ncbi:unnamed protein product [Rotaria sordida]|uniref:Uncharacterized protein n=1 Tax=Rotaria sordida TaxID=392033 RepID=A0A815HK87_9BILA|nr:unnamed protein product [Rotaria sordida]CAF3955445.1 unnamed protein product [Rotaria sordida]
MAQSGFSYSYASIVQIESQGIIATMIEARTFIFISSNYTIGGVPPDNNDNSTVVMTNDEGDLESIESIGTEMNTNEQEDVNESDADARSIICIGDDDCLCLSDF